MDNQNKKKNRFITIFAIKHSFKWYLSSFQKNKIKRSIKLIITTLLIKKIIILK